MDILCTRCGEPWDIYEVLHGEIERFERNGCLVSRCPCCWSKQSVELPVDLQRTLSAVAEVAPLFGDDIDGFAAFLEDQSLTV